jgi:crotonobetainyl-CoA:carnitine CoA-transferase CaiB-like acyl-CoA transferase
MSGCMDGVRIVELGQVVVIPAAAAILADWGADVIKVEPPLIGDQGRGTTHLEGGKCTNGINYLFEVQNRNKRGMTINLKNGRGMAVLCKLMERADVFMSNLQPQALAKFGLTYQELSKLNPRLIYATVTGYGHKGHKRDKPGYDYAAFWANSGMMDKISDPDSSPRRQRPGIGDSTTSLAVAGGICAGLFAREKTGKGQELSFSLYNTAVWALQADIQIALSTGRELPYSNIKKAANPLWNVYRTKDGRWLELVMLQTDLFWQRFCRVMGLASLENDPRFSSHYERARNCEALIKIISPVFESKTLVEWEEIFESEELFSSRVQTVTEVVNDPQAIENDFFLEFNHPVVDKIRLIASPVMFNGRRPPIKSPAPALSQHTEEVLLELGYTWEDIEALRADGAI